MNTEKRCNRCGEYWPDTREYFYWNGEQLRADCKACYLERRDELRNMEQVAL